MDLTSFERSLILCLTHLWIGAKKFLTHNFTGFPAEPTEWMLCASPSGGSGGVIYIAVLPPTPNADFLTLGTLLSFAWHLGCAHLFTLLQGQMPGM